jgi:quercetin dioxygenase-like cupin family protein
VLTYEAHDTSAARLAHGKGEAHAYLLRFDAGGAIVQHEAGYGQLFIVLDGCGWVSGRDGARAEIGAGDVVLFDRGEHHAKGSDTGMTAVMVQVRDLVPTSSTLDSAS